MVAIDDKGNPFFINFSDVFATSISVADEMKIGTSNTITNSPASIISGTLNTISGRNTSSQGCTIVVGKGNTASGVIHGDAFATIVVGENNKCTSKYCAVFGADNILSDPETADEAGSTIVSGKSNTVGTGAFLNAVFGYNNTIRSKYSSAFGNCNIVSGDNSICIGNYNDCSGQSSVVVGYGNTCSSNYQIIFGKYAENDSNAVRVTGWGANSGSRANIETLNTDGDLSLAGNCKTSGYRIQTISVSGGTLTVPSVSGVYSKASMQGLTKIVFETPKAGYYPEFMLELDQVNPAVTSISWPSGLYWYKDSDKTFKSTNPAPDFSTANYSYVFEFEYDGENWLGKLKYSKYIS